MAEPLRHILTSTNIFLSSLKLCYLSAKAHYLIGLPVLVLCLQYLLLYGAIALGTEVCVGGGHLTLSIEQTIFFSPQSSL